MGKSTISMAIFHSYVCLPEGKVMDHIPRCIGMDRVYGSPVVTDNIIFPYTILQTNVIIEIHHFWEANKLWALPAANYSIVRWHHGIIVRWHPPTWAGPIINSTSVIFKNAHVTLPDGIPQNASPSPGFPMTVKPIFSHYSNRKIWSL